MFRMVKYTYKIVVLEVKNMYRTMKTTFRPSPKTNQQLFDVRRICGEIWNDCVQLARLYYRLGGKWITKTQLQSELKGLYPIHSQTIQAVAHKFLDAREGTKEARQKGYKQTKYPWKQKYVFNPKWVDRAFSLDGKN